MIVSALPSPAKTSETGTHRLSAVSATVNDGDSVEVDGDVVTDDNDNPVAFVNAPGEGISASVSDVAEDTDYPEVVVDTDGSDDVEVTVFAVVE